MFSPSRAAGCALFLAVAACAGTNAQPEASTSPSPAPIAEQAAPAAPQAARWGSAILSREASWFATAEARAIADSILLYQSAEGGWPKNTDLTVPPPSPADLPAANLSNTIDNHGTTLPMQFLARVIQAAPDPRYVQAFNRGFDYLIAAQYPSGGWPQFFPLRDGYWSRITFNDDAMIRVVRLLRDVAGGKGPYTFVNPGRRAAAASAVARATELILKTQVVQQGRPTAWAAQYDEVSLAPAKARAFEPASLSGSESVGIVRYLMSIDNPSPQVVAAIEGAVRWFEAVKIEGMRLEDYTNDRGEADKRLVPDPTAEPLWARFYELGSNRPIFTNRDSQIHYDYAQLERERRVGYGFLGTWPATLLERDYPKWKAKVGRP